MALSEQARAAKLFLKSGKVVDFEVEDSGIIIPPPIRYRVRLYFPGAPGITTDMIVTPGKIREFSVSDAEAWHLERVWKKQQKKQKKRR